MCAGIGQLMEQPRITRPYWSGLHEATPFPQ